MTKFYNMQVTKKYINQLSYKIIGCAITVHKELGPGLLESVYEPCFISELINAGLEVKSQLRIPIKYKGQDYGGHLKLDLLINDLIIVEEKAVEMLIPLYTAQLLSYLKLTNKPKGLLINFHSTNIKDNLVYLVSEEYSKYPDE